MRAWRIEELGHPSVALRLDDDTPEPVPGPGQVRVRVEAGIVNFADILLCQGVYQDRPGTPFTPGLETSGVIEVVGPDVDLEPGTRIAGMTALPAGGYAERALVRASTAVVVPDDVSPDAATVLYSTFQTAHVGLHHRAGLTSGEWLLVLGASSGVGAAAVQLGAACGARVVAAAGSNEKRDHCRRLGASHVVDSRGSDLRADVLEITGGDGVDVVFDPVGGPAGEAARRLMAWEGRLVVIGFASGDIPTYPSNHVLVKNYSVVGLHWGAYAEHGRADVIQATHAQLVDLYRQQAINPDISRVVALKEIPDALEAIEQRTVTGRLVMMPNHGQAA